MGVRIVFGLAVVALLFLATELFVPRAAERNLREELSRSGEVRSVDIESFPALRLLWGSADDVEVVMGDVRAGPGEIADLVDSTRRTEKLDARAATARVGTLVLRDLRMTKDDAQLRGEAGVASGDLAAALPPGLGVQPLLDGDQLVLEGTAEVLGAEVSARARLVAEEGSVIVAPEGILGGFARLTVFSDPRMSVDAVGARPRPDGFTMTAEGRLR